MLWGGMGETKIGGTGVCGGHCCGNQLCVCGNFVRVEWTLSAWLPLSFGMKLDGICKEGGPLTELYTVITTSFLQLI